MTISAAERTTPIRFTTTPIIPTRKSSFRPPPFSYNQLSNITVNKGESTGRTRESFWTQELFVHQLCLDLTCFYESGVSYFSLTPIDEMLNTNLSTCCELCHKNMQCLSWTFVSANSGRCTHFDAIRPNPAYVRGYVSGFSDKTTGKLSLTVSALNPYLAISDGTTLCSFSFCVSFVV